MSGSNRNMNIGLVMIVRDEEAVLKRCLSSVKPLISEWTIVDTGSTDSTRKIAKEMTGTDPIRRKWRSFGENLTEALALAEGEWILRLDADMTAEWHSDFPEWLESDPDPECTAWMVSIMEQGTHYRLPLLIRGGMDFRYVGETHEYLDTAGRKTRSLLGLTVTHHADGSGRENKLERDLALLEPRLKAGEARATFYSAECLRFLGRTEEAIELYRLRATMPDFEEERWYATYQAAKMDRSVEALLACYRERPWRHEPLRAASDLVRETIHDDVLFLEAG